MTNETMKEDVELKYSKYSCFGKCEVFDFYIYTNRKIKLVAKNNMKLEGNYISELSVEKIDNAILFLDEMNIENLDTSYLTQVTDLQKIEITYKNIKVEFHKRKAPKELLLAMEKLDALINEQNWTEEKN